MKGEIRLTELWSKRICADALNAITPRRFHMAIKRVWHRWTTPEYTDKYKNLLHNEVFHSQIITQMLERY